jgi:hypothetical protein
MPAGESGERQLLIPLVWLRDHCRSAAAYNWQTHQRRSKMTQICELGALAHNTKYGGYGIPPTL